MSYKDEELEEKIKLLRKEVEIKRDSKQPNSIERKYYRKISQYLDKIFKKIK